MKKKKLWIAVLIIVIAAVVAIVAVVVVKKNSSSGVKDDTTASSLVTTDNGNVELASVYSCDLTIYGDSNTILYVYFNTDTQEWAIEMNGETAATGRYKINGNEIVTTTYDDDGNEAATISYILDDGYLLLEDGMYAGEIPEADAFEATVSKTDSTGMEIRYTFNEDGTYTCTEIPEGEKEKDAIVMNGTYTRDGNIITRTLSDNEMIPFYVYGNHLFTSFYQQDDSEEAATAAEEAQATLDGDGDVGLSVYPDTQTTGE